MSTDAADAGRREAGSVRDGEGARARRADAGGYRVRPLDGRSEMLACVELQKEIWGRDFTERVPPALLKIAQRIGGVTTGAFDADGTLVGFVFGISGIRDGGLAHWSDMLAVRRGHRGRGLGRRLKLHQRNALLPLGVRTVLWTFDPLESRNAHLNFGRLGVLAHEYRESLYGETDSVLHRGIGTDRLVATWRIAAGRVRRRLDGAERPPTAADLAGVPLVNPTSGEADAITSEPPDLSLTSARVRIAVPTEIQALKARAPDLAADWRAKTRAAFSTYLDRGYSAVEVVREGERTCYLLATRAAGLLDD